MNAVQECIREIERLVSEANEIDGEERDHRAALRAVESQRKRLVKDIQKLIKTGESSGDSALDIQIMFDGSVATDKAYQRLEWLQAAVKRHFGDLVATSHYGHFDIGLLPEEPSISWFTDIGALTRDQVEIPVQRRLSISTYDNELLPTELDMPVRITHHVFKSLFGDIPTGDSGKLDNLEVFVGNRAVQAMMKTLEPSKALRVYIASRLLNRPLEVHPELAREIRDRRERFIPVLIEQMAEVKRLEDHLSESQYNPAWGLQNPVHQSRGTVERKIIKTEDGVTIDFGFSHLIKNTRQDLWTMVNNAVIGCEMADNPTLQQAAKLVNYELPG